MDKSAHPQILLIFVFANCTNFFQPKKVNLQRPFKHCFKQQVDNFTTKEINKQLDKKDLADAKLDTKMTFLKLQLYSWLYQVWLHVNNPTIIKRGWQLCGLDRAFIKTFQTSTMDENMKNSLFKEELAMVEED